MTARFVRVCAVFVEQGTGLPITGPRHSVKLYDEDPVGDDLLGQATLQAGGRATVLVSTASFDSVDSPGETRPDLFFVLYDGTRERWRTPVFVDVDLPAADPGASESAATLDLGTFRVP